MKKYIYLILIIFLSGCANTQKIENNLGAEPTEDEVIAQLQIDLVAEQEEWKRTHDKYKAVEKAEKLPHNIKYWVDEYEAPDRNYGYQIYIKKKNGSTKSFGSGIESTNRSFDWTEEEIATSTK